MTYPQTRKNNLLATLADEKYLDQAKQLFASAYLDGGWTGDYLLLAQNIPEKELAWFKDRGILVKECQPLCAYSFKYWPNTVLNKFYLFQPEFKRWDNIVFLDADIIIKAPLENLTAGSGFKAYAYNGLKIKLKDEFVGYDMKGRLYRDLKKNYRLNSIPFNSGVFAFATDLITEQTFTELVKLFRTYEPIMESDEATLNLFFYRQFSQLPADCNILQAEFWVRCLPIRKLFLRRIKAGILHFNGNNKPWLKTNPWHSQWQENLRQAENINFALPPKPITKKTTELKKTFYLLRLLKLIDRLSPLFLWPIDLFYFLDRRIGLAGLWLKKHYPKIYSILKRGNHGD